jgi:hypothetical protein
MTDDLFSTVQGYADDISARATDHTLLQDRHYIWIDTQDFSREDTTVTTYTVGFRRYADADHWAVGIPGTANPAVFFYLPDAQAYATRLQTAHGLCVGAEHPWKEEA